LNRDDATALDLKSVYATVRRRTTDFTDFTDEEWRRSACVFRPTSVSDPSVKSVQSVVKTIISAVTFHFEAMPSKLPSELRFFRGDTLLGIITPGPTPGLGDLEAPWHAGAFHPSPDFGSAQPLFQKELELLNAEETQGAPPDAWEDVWDAICAPGLSLLAPDDTVFLSEPFLIHIDGTKTWWCP
jgi:hypothetical protein